MIWEGGAADAGLEGTAEEEELDPAGDAGGEGEADGAEAICDIGEGGLGKMEIMEKDRVNIRAQGEGEEKAEGGGEGHANDGEPEGGAGIAQCVEGRGVEAAPCGGEEADGGSHEDVPDIEGILRAEVTALTKGGDEVAANNEKAGNTGDDVERDGALAGDETGAEFFVNFLAGAGGAGHLGELGGGDGHAEEADGQGVEELGVLEAGDCAAHLEKAGDHAIDECAQLDHAAADEDGTEAAEYLADGGEGDIEAEGNARSDGGAIGGFAPINKGELDGKLKQRTGDGTPCEYEDKTTLGGVSAEEEESADHGGIPKDWSDVGDEEKAVAIEDAEAPCGEDEYADAGEEYLDDVEGEIALGGIEARAYDGA